MNTLLQDLRFALRQIRRSPGFAITAVFILALGIAANVIVFGVLQALILQPLDVPHPGQVVTFATREQGYPIYSYPEVRDVREGNTVFSAVGAYMFDMFGLEINGVTRPAWGDEVSGEFFEVMDVKPFLERLLRRSDDDHPGAAEVAVITSIRHSCFASSSDTRYCSPVPSGEANSSSREGTIVKRLLRRRNGLSYN